MHQSEGAEGSDRTTRRDVMRICAEAAAEELAACVDELAPDAPVRNLRPPETGLVMLRGRTGGDGAPFNLGEATVTRAAIQIQGGVSGFAYHLGRDARKARHAAIIDALWQDPARRDRVAACLERIRDRLVGAAELDARRTAATRVDFFTLVRGED